MAYFQGLCFRECKKTQLAEKMSPPSCWDLLFSSAPAACPQTGKPHDHADFILTARVQTCSLPLDARASLVLNKVKLQATNHDQSWLIKVASYQSPIMTNHYTHPSKPEPALQDGHPCRHHCQQTSHCHPHSSPVYREELHPRKLTWN